MSGARYATDRFEPLVTNLRAAWARAYVRIFAASREPSWILFETVMPVLGMFAIPEILGGKDDWLVGNLIKESFLGTRDWPFGSMLSIMLTLAVLAIAGAAAWLARRGVARA